MLLGPDGQDARRYGAYYDSYTGASRSRRSMRSWNPIDSDPDSAIIYDLPTLRARSYDLYRNNPLAASAIKTAVTSVIGPGLKYQARIDREFLGMSDDEADAWEENAEREWNLFANTKEIDITEQANFAELSDLFLRSRMVGGDVFAVLPSVKRRGSSYKTRIQLIESGRVTNPDNKPDNDTLVAGIERDQHGRPTTVHIQKRNPNNRISSKKDGWDSIPIFGSTTGRRNVLHGMRQERPGQARGVPFLAPIIEKLRQMDRYSDNEVMAAVTSSMITMFIEQTQEMPFSQTEKLESGVQEMKLGNAAIIGLGPGERANGFNPQRPNSQFDPFMSAMARWCGAALEIPSELLLKHFMASYSASRAAFMMAWKFFMGERAWEVINFCTPIKELFLIEAVSLGRITAPGFLTDPLIRQAYCGAEWIGPAKGQIDELKEGQAAKLYNEMGVKTLSEITAEVSGGDWDRKARQIQKERKKMKAMQKEIGGSDEEAFVPSEEQDFPSFEGMNEL